VNLESGRVNSSQRSEEVEQECPRCRVLERELACLSIDCQQKVQALAAERERANALFIAYPPQGLHVPALAPGRPPIDNRPLRYRLVDVADRAINRLGPARLLSGGMVRVVHQLAPSLASKPLRYRAIDLANDLMKRRFGRLHGLAKQRIQEFRK
jgi:hypothetical protein